MHYHVMHYMPGCLPDGDILTTDTIADARETLASEIDSVIDDMHDRDNDTVDDDAVTANMAMVEIIRNDGDGDVTYALQHGSGYYVFDVDGYTYAVESCDLTDCDTVE